MSDREFTWAGAGIRFLAAVLLILATYNPEGFSYYHWALAGLPDFDALKAFAGVVLLIAWTVFLRATMRSLGAFGLALALAFFGTLVWLLIEYAGLPTDSVRVVSYLVIFVLSGVLAAGLSWSLVRRRVSGQLDVDDLEP